jgi:hypothetical protein
VRELECDVVAGLAGRLCGVRVFHE